MHKTQLGPVNAMYPSLTTIVGTLVDGKPNWITIAHVGILTHAAPQLLSIGVGKIHHSNRGIFENKTFSINIPSREMLIVTDYVGLVSGKKTRPYVLKDNNGVKFRASLRMVEAGNHGFAIEVEPKDTNDSRQKFKVSCSR